jgi:hypothetical protein
VLSREHYGMLAYSHDLNFEKQIVLDELIRNKHRLSKDKTSKKNNNYNIYELHNFARKLDIPVNQRKADLIDNLLLLIDQRELQLRG